MCTSTCVQHTTHVHVCVNTTCGSHMNVHSTESTLYTRMPCAVGTHTCMTQDTGHVHMHSHTVYSLHTCKCAHGVRYVHTTHIYAHRCAHSKWGNTHRCTHVCPQACTMPMHMYVHTHAQTRPPDVSPAEGHTGLSAASRRLRGRPGAKLSRGLPHRLPPPAAARPSGPQASSRRPWPPFARARERLAHVSPTQRGILCHQSHVHLTPSPPPNIP